MKAFLEGENLYFREIQEADIAKVLSWQNDKEVTKYLYRGTFPGNLEKAKEEFHRNAKSEVDVELAIASKTNDKLIGVVGLHGIDWISRVSEFRILIGEKDHWGKGLGTEATTLMCCYGFEVLNLHKIILGLNAENERALRSYQSVGFVKEGEFREEFYRAGRYFNLIRMGLLRTEYREKLKAWKVYPKIKAQYPTLP
jgi:RimJ/RimL family protein N-acetyltransferase